MSEVLIIDASTSDGERYRGILADEGVDAALCSSSSDAVEMLAAGGDRSWKVALVLWEMSGVPSGAELLVRFKKCCPDISLVVMTGALDAALAARAFALGAEDFLLKPIDKVVLKQRVGRLLAKQDPSSPLALEMRKRIVGNSSSLIRALQQCARVIAHDAMDVLIIGESGTGKELLAREIHRLGVGENMPWIPVNVAAITRDLVESHLFGHEKGAFTGATDQHIGFVEQASGGVLFLDEIGDLPPELQVKLNRTLQEREFRRVGGNKEIAFNARVICATHHDLANEVETGSFRQDFYYRIAETTVHVPPLRDRFGDIDVLADHFLAEYNEERGKALHFSREVRGIMRSYPFPGNIRELKNYVRSAATQCEDNEILPAHLPLQELGVFIGVKPDLMCAEELSFWPERLLAVAYEEAIKEITRAFDRHYLPERLEQARQNLTKASKVSGIDVKTFRKHWEECGLPPLRS